MDQGLVEGLWNISESLVEIAAVRFKASVEETQNGSRFDAVNSCWRLTVRLHKCSEIRYLIFNLKNEFMK